MARLRSQNELILGLLDFLRTAQPGLDVKPGTVARDLFVDSQATEVAALYNELSRIATLQSLRLALGNDLDKLASNYGATRKLGRKSSGPVLLTFNSINADIPINRGETVSSRNGSTFVVQSNIVVSPVFANTYRATASQYRADLDLANIKDEFAVEVMVEASSTGIQGNISKYNIISTGISGISNVTNVLPFSGGTQSEDDAAFRSRVLAIFSGANTGTELGYKNAVLEDPSALDALVVMPGDDLMTRDGTQIFEDPETGERTIIAEGTGGKVDIYSLGSRLVEIVESYIYADKSNTGKPTNPANDFVLGQILDDAGKTITRRRLDNLEAGILPSQPVNNIIRVSGSISGSNFIRRRVDHLGRETGNYELIKDAGEFGGSPWGFDRLRWISDRISDLAEDKTKSTFNGQDALTYPNSRNINKAVQKVTVVNENSKVNPNNRTIIQLAHKPITSVTRVFNATTGERYIVSNQNPDGTTDINMTGRIFIAGKSLPSVSDALQVDYTWIFDYDPYIDYDGKKSNINPNPRQVNDSIDWGYSNAVRREQVSLIMSGSRLVANTTHPISSVVSVNAFEQHSTSVTLVNGRPAVVVPESVLSVISIVRNSDGTDLWNTSREDGTFSGFTIFLPTDGLSTLNDSVEVIYNAIDVFNADGYEGSFNSNVINIVPTIHATPGTIVECNYIANVSNLLPPTVLSQLPAIRNGNSFDTTESQLVGTQPTTHIFNNNVIVQNLRQAPSNLMFTVSGAVSPGIFTITGETLTKVGEAVFTVGTGGLTIQLSQAIRNKLNIPSNGSIPSNIKLARVVSVEKVQATSNFEVLSVDHIYDIKGYIIRDNKLFKSESVQDNTALAASQNRNILSFTEMILPRTADNQSNAPTVGDRLRVTFYYTTEDDIEHISFSKSGTLVSNKRFTTVNTVAISSGFSSGSSQSSTVSISAFNQPVTGNRYQGTYDYIAPVPNERITVRFNSNKLISDGTLALENARPINADVLLKESKAINVDTELAIVLFKEFENNSNTVIQNVQDAVTAAMDSPRLKTTIDSSDLVVIAQGVEGVDRVRVVRFNRANTAGSVLSIVARKNQFIKPNSIIITQEFR
jgi:hypothetical protein